MIRVETRDAIRSINNLAVKLSPQQTKLALSRSINRTLTQGRTVARRKVAQQYNIPQAVLSNVIQLSRSTSNTLTGHLLADGKHISLINFKPKFETPTKSIRGKRRGGNVVRAFKRRKKKVAKGTVEIKPGERIELPYAFMTPRISAVFARGKYGSRGFEKRFTRDKSSGNDLPIQALVSVSVHTAALTPESREAVLSKIDAVFPQELNREISYRISQLNR
ncbi:hypothetical protein [Chitinophaga sp. CF418]|uniref:hypothetical protein n=1 Tax=Chitinophaga sp. CF418 TaxID=1855287 RepID=UPI0009200DD6|nr:hypothetical protein [Chitinophaga sp. CF418]SHN42270.1 hypothetical protein SAMN05216311_114161 [Chitinophaga sp. CF418]